MSKPLNLRNILFLSLATVVCTACGFRTFTFAHLSDPQIGFLDPTEGFARTDSLYRRAVTEVNAWGPDLAVITGDLVNSPWDTLQNRLFEERTAALAMPVYLVPGNHDIMGYDALKHDQYVALRGYDRFSFTHKGCAFIGFDSNCIKDGATEAEEAQFRWLEGELQAARRMRHIFLFLHCPVLLNDADEPDDYFNFPHEKRERYLHLFAQYGVTAVFAGHTHMDYQALWNGIPFFTAGPVGTPLGRGYSGYNQVRVTRKGVEVRYVAL